MIECIIVAKATNNVIGKTSSTSAQMLFNCSQRQCINPNALVEALLLSLCSLGEPLLFLCNTGKMSGVNSHVIPDTKIDLTWDVAVDTFDWPCRFI